MPAIVQVNESITEAPTPNTLQGTGAIISQGGTNTSPGTKTLLTQPSSLTPFLNAAKSLATLTQTTGLATATASEEHGFAVDDTLLLTVAGATPVAYNGTFLCTVTTTTAFTYAIPSGTASSASGTMVYTDADVSELLSEVTTFFGQGGSTGCYVLELGPGNASDGVAFLDTWIQNNPNDFAYGNGFYGFYSYLVPREWDGNADYLALLAKFEAPTSKTYFFTTTTLATYAAYTPLMKCVVPLIEAPVFGVYPANALTAITWSDGVVTGTTTTAHGVSPGQWFQIAGVTPSGYNGYALALSGTTGSTLSYALATNPGAETVLGTLVENQNPSTGIPATEFSMAAAFNAALSFNPGGGFVPPFAFAPLFGVTPFPTLGNTALLTTLANANISVVGTGAEGGITNAILFNGHTADGNTFNFWYTTDWIAINVNLNISNAVINGSASSISPLYDNPTGIATLQGVGANTLASGIAAGMIYGTLIQTELTAQQFAANNNAGNYNGYCVINAVPFSSYYTLNPGNYKSGTYGGFAISMAPQQGFQNIIVNINATTFVG